MDIRNQTLIQSNHPLRRTGRIDSGGTLRYTVCQQFCKQTMYLQQAPSSNI